ncbi:MAG: ABC transporter ATP-binding protein, partial [Alphaproteobacteria bacterium]|nr:ABC transporter ATP-binding protein [Alphaproteobacteria bacterium]
GVIVEQGSVGNVFNVPNHPYTKELLSAFAKTATREDFNARKLMDARHISVSFPIKKSLFGKVLKEIKAVNDVSLSLYEGKTLGVVGESGSGKTTLGMCLANLISYKGDILTAKSVHIQNEKDFRKNVQVVFQDPYNSLNPRMTVGEIVEEGIKVHFGALDKEERRERVIKVLRDVGLGEEIYEQYPHEFSGGQRQRIAIARALAVEPKIMILDEPTSALDVTVQAEIIRLLKRLQNERGISYLFISHDMRAVRAISHEVAVMRKGRIIEQGTADEVFLRPQTGYAQELIKAALA